MPAGACHRAGQRPDPLAGMTVRVRIRVRIETNDNRVSAMNSPSLTPSGLTPFFDGHNDVLLRLFKREGADAPRAFIDGEGKGQLDLPMAVQGGFAGGLFAIFVPSPKAAPAR